MKVTRKSSFSGKENTMDLDITEEQLADYETTNGPLVQNAFPNLSADEREFIMTGITPDEWNDMFVEEEFPE